MMPLQVWDPEKIVIIPDHYIFTSDARANRNVDILRYSPAFCKVSVSCLLSLPLHEPLLALDHKLKLCWRSDLHLETLYIVIQHRSSLTLPLLPCRDVVKKYGIKYFYDITDRSNFRANPDYKGVCHVALAQEGHCKPGACRLH